MKKLMILSAALFMICSTSCSTAKSSADTPSETIIPEVTQTLYREDRLAYPDDITGLPLLIMTGDAPAYICNSGDDIILIRLDGELNEVSRKVLVKGSKSEIFQFTEIDGGGFCGVIAEAETDPSLIGTDDYFTTAAVSAKLMTWDADAELIGTEEIEGFGEHFSYGRNMLTGLIPYSSGGYIIGLDSSIIQIGSNGDIVDSTEIETGYAMCLDSDGKAVISLKDSYYYLDGSTLAVEGDANDFGISSSLTGSVFAGNSGFTLFFTMNNGIYGLAPDGSLTKVVDSLPSHIMISDVVDIISVSEGKFLAACMSTTDGTKYIAEFSVRPDDWKENKKTVIIASPGDYTVPDNDSKINEYNRMSSDYKIEYMKYNETDELRDAMLTGKAPDICFYMDTGVMYRFANIGAFAEMNELHEQYGGFSPHDMLSNVEQAFTYKGGIYAASDAFQIPASVCSSDVVDRKYSCWTLDEFLDIAENMPENMTLTASRGFTEPSDVFDYLCTENITAWVDYDKYTSRFDTDEFVRTLKFCKSVELAEYIDMTDAHNYMSDDEMNVWIHELHAAVSRKEALLEPSFVMSHLASLSELSEFTQLAYKDMTLVSKPSSDGSGCISPVPGHMFSVVKNGNCTEGAWDFISYIMSKDVQSPNIDQPVTMSYYSTLASAFEKNLKRDQYISQNPETRSPDGTINFNGEFYSGEVDDETLEYVKQYISGSTRLGGSDPALTAILSDETGQYFGGEITAEECASRINDRVTLLLSEQS